MCSGGPVKSELRRAIGRYNWSVDEALLGNKLYHTSTELKPVPRLIALHPSIDLSKTRDWHDLKLLLQVCSRSGAWQRAWTIACPVQSV